MQILNHENQNQLVPDGLGGQMCDVTGEAARTQRHFSWSGTRSTDLTIAKWGSCIQMLTHASGTLILPKSGYQGHI